MKNRPWYQLLIDLYLHWLVVGFAVISSIIDTIYNLIVIPPTVTYFGTVFILLGLGLGYYSLSRRPIEWISKDGTPIQIKGMKLGTVLFAVGLLAALWFPRIIVITTPNLPPASVSTQPVTENSNYVQIDLSSWANWSISPSYHLNNPLLTGPVILDGIPFVVPQSNEGVIQTQNQALINEPTSITIPVEISNPHYIHILVSGGFVQNEFRAIPVGILTFMFEDGTLIKTPIIAGQCLREGWYFTDGTTNTMITSIEETGECKNAYAEKQTRDGHAVLSVIDRIALPIPNPAVSLTQIRIEDTSVETVNSVDPSIIIIAITVERK